MKNRKITVCSTSTRTTPQACAADIVRRVHSLIVLYRQHRWSFTLTDLLSRIQPGQRQTVFCTVLRYVDAGLLRPECDAAGVVSYRPIFNEVASDQQQAAWDELKSEYTDEVWQAEAMEVLNTRT